jgi:hypothetical protein
MEAGWGMVIVFMAKVERKASFGNPGSPGTDTGRLAADNPRAVFAEGSGKSNRSNSHSTY